MSVVGFLHPPSGSAITQSRMQGSGSQKGGLVLIIGILLDNIIIQICFKNYKKKLPEISGSFL